MSNSRYTYATKYAIRNTQYARLVQLVRHQTPRYLLSLRHTVQIERERDSDRNRDRDRDRQTATHTSLSHVSFPVTFAVDGVDLRVSPTVANA